MPLSQHQLFYRRSSLIILPGPLFFNIFLHDLGAYITLDTQRLNAGDDSANAFVLSSEAAFAGAESTKQMQAQVTH